MASINQLFLSCDWGTSSSRLRLVEVPGLQVMAEVTDNSGIAFAFENWKQQSKNETERLSFYQDIIKQKIDKLQEKSGLSLSAVPLILSGMVSSSIGMKELPYKEVPFLPDGSDLLVYTISATRDFQHEIFIISGVRYGDDVMRGEEIQVAGSVGNQKITDQLFILPGTHSKHVVAANGHIKKIKTYMTGELFNLLCTKSILASSVEPGGSFEDKNNQQSFGRGIQDSLVHNPLHTFFLVRTNQLFQRISKKENYYYLSGLLIGLELKELINKPLLPITLICNNELKEVYESAIYQLECTTNLQVADADQALIKGHYQIYVRLVKQ